MNLTDLAQTLTPLGIVALLGFAFRQEKRTTRLETVLTGADGQNGVNGTVKQLRKEHDALRERVEHTETDVAVLKERIA